VLSDGRVSVGRSTGIAGEKDTKFGNFVCEEVSEAVRKGSA